MADGDPVKVEPATARHPNERIVNKYLDAAGIALERHLGGQAAVADDRARQHRRGDVDHRGRVADSGAERLGQEGDPQPGRRRLVHHPAVPAIARSDEEIERVQSNPRITLQRRAARSAATARSSAAVMADGQRERRASRTATRRSTSTNIQGVTPEYVELLQLRRRARAADEPDRGRRRAAR